MNKRIGVFIKLMLLFNVGLVLIFAVGLVAYNYTQNEFIMGLFAILELIVLFLAGGVAFDVDNKEFIDDIKTSVAVPEKMVKQKVAIKQQLKPRKLKPRKSKYTNHPQQEEIIQAYKNGVKLKDIVAKFGVSTGGLYTILGKNREEIGIPKRNYNSYSLNYEDIANDYKRGMSNDDIVTKYGLHNKSMIYYALKKTNTKTNRHFS